MKPTIITVLGWSKPLVRLLKYRAVVKGASHMLVLLSNGTVRARCGAARCDTFTPPSQSPPVKDAFDVCTRCAAPYAKEPRRGSLRRPDRPLRPPGRPRQPTTIKEDDDHDDSE